MTKKKEDKVYVEPTFSMVALTILLFFLLFGGFSFPNVKEVKNDKRRNRTN